MQQDYMGMCMILVSIIKPLQNDKVHDIHRYSMKQTILYKMFRVIKKILSIIFLVSSANSLKCISMKNQE